ncbi:MAG TPA: ATP-binding cassette domain-containing protein, partial [Clostridia bacterium]|nr:ATP-binding cassette domain-containing protein [Clostridia bacterium]
MPVVIETDNLTHSYSRGTAFETKALSGVTLKVYEGEFLAVTGPAGSGKTTLIQHFNGLLKPSKGRIKIFARGRPVEDKNLWREVGLVFQIPERQLFAETVFDEVAFGLVNMSLGLSDIKGRVKEALSQVGFDYQGFKDRLPLALSQGQQRRVAIASVLAMRPTILVMDEPTAGIDPLARKSFWAGIQELRKKRTFTIVLVTHNMDEVAEHADRVVVMKKGKVILDGSPRK